MNKRKTIGVLLILGLFFSIALLITGCSSNGEQSSESKSATASGSDSKQEDVSDNPIFALYNQIEINDTKENVEKALGATGNTAAQGSYVYVDPDTGYAVNVFYNTKDLVTLKVLIPTTGARELIELSNASVTKEQVAKISQGMTRSNVKKALIGVGVEMLRMVVPNSQDKEAYALAWINTDGSILIVTFDADTDTVLSAEFKDNLL
ncbi:MAG: hypothetical protein L6276_00585 [Acetobacterium sp.]|nr:hypothetical protein [Bacillota bacterium]MCG2728778.1 hypothetical protein [Acetobacterium sp.]